MTGKGIGVKTWELSYYTAPLGWDGKQITFDEELADTELEVLRKAGVSWTGFNGAGHHEPMAFDLEAAVDKIVGMMKRHGLQLSSFHFAGPTFAEPGTSQEEVRELMRKSVESFAPFRPKSFVVHPWWPERRVGGVADIYPRLVRTHGLEALMKTIAANLKFLAKATARHQIKIAVETMGRFMPLRGELAALVDMVDEPNVGYCLDSGHIHACGDDVAATIRSLGDRIFETHLHDNRALGAKDRHAIIPSTSDEHLSPGFGTIPWIDVINALRDVGFQGPATFETRGWPGVEDQVESHRLAVRWWRACEALAAKKHDRKEC